MSNTSALAGSAVRTEPVPRLVEAFNRHDAAGCADLFIEDGAREHRFLSRTIAPGRRFPRAEGRARIAEGYERFFAAVSDAVVHCGRMDQGAGGAVWMEWTISGIRAGDADVPGGPVSFPGVSLYVLDGGRIAQERIYMDPALLVATEAR